MTQPADPATTVDNTVDDQKGVDPTDTQQGTVDEPQAEPEPTPNSEAARYRVQLREAQAERDALSERLTGYQRRECEAALADLLDVPGDLFDIGQAEMASFYGDDGTLNEAELRAAAGALLEQRPRLGIAKPGFRNWGQNGDIIPLSGGATWSDVIKR